jgi:hypothetical protein
VTAADAIRAGICQDFGLGKAAGDYGHNLAGRRDDPAFQGDDRAQGTNRLAGRQSGLCPPLDAGAVDGDAQAPS